MLSVLHVQEMSLLRTGGGQIYVEVWRLNGWVLLSNSLTY